MGANLIYQAKVSPTASVLKADWPLEKMIKKALKNEKEVLLDRRLLLGILVINYLPTSEMNARHHKLGDISETVLAVGS